MKIIMLDIDGVLNCDASQSRCGAFIGIDNDKVKRLRRIVDATGARIVLVSSWKTAWERFHKDDNGTSGRYLDSKLRREGLHILDKTTDHIWDRGRGILDWISARNVDSFIILDDEEFDYDECGVMSRLVKTSFYDGGLRDDHVELAIELLNTETIDVVEARDGTN